MQLGEIIRKYRKENNLTQEEVAARLGVSAPAVNKWENGVSLPDIMLLSPIARLFGISTDQLLSFQEDLTQEEINQFIIELDEVFKKQPYWDGFELAKKKVEQYPNCEQLIWQIAVILDMQHVVQKVEDAEKSEIYCYSLYQRVLESQDTDAVIQIMQVMLANIEDICSFCRSSLYEHMDFKEPRREFISELKENLKKCFRDEESYEFLKKDARWQEIVRYNS